MGKATFNTTLNTKSNGAFNHGLFKFGMHPTAERLWLAARTVLRPNGDVRPLLPSELAKFLKLNSQNNLNNWGSRGLSKSAILKASKRLEISAHWLETGEGEMTSTGGAPDEIRFLRAEESSSGYVVDGLHTSYAGAIKKEAATLPYDLIEQALRTLVIVGSDKDEVIALVKEKAKKSAEIQAAIRERAAKSPQ